MPTAQPSLRRTLLQALVGPTTLLLLAAGTIVYGTAKSVVGSAYDQNLLNLAHGVASHVHATPGGPALELPPAAELMLRTDTHDDIYFHVRDDQFRILGGDHDFPLLEELDAASTLPVPYQSGLDPEAEPVVLKPHSRTVFRDIDYQGESVRTVRLYRSIGKSGIYVTVGETLHKRRDSMDRLLLGFLSAGVLLLLAAAVAARFGIPSGLAPLQRLTVSLRRRAGTDLSPTDITAVPHEVRELVAALNALLERLRRAQLQQREFLQDAAHQLRTPLAGLQMQLELLESHPLDQKARNELRQSVNRVTRLTNQLLALARAESGGRMLADASPIELAPLIDDLVEGWLRIADRRAIDLGIHREAASMIGDPTLLQELISNLMDNALKYVPDGGSVTLRCAPNAAADQIEIDVSDSGPGIPESVREQVFERFYRSAGTQVSGSGLGLSIAREIVRCHHGDIRIINAPQGQGTLVRVRLPTHNKDSGR